MTIVYGTSRRTGRSHAGEFFEIAVARPRSIFVRLDSMDGEVVSVPASMRDALAKTSSGLESYNILDRVKVTRTTGTARIVTGEIHSVVFERPGIGWGIMIQDDNSTMSCWVPLPDGVIVEAA